MVTTALERAGHLTRRFAGSLSRRPPPPAEDAWALAHLLPGERRLWQTMPVADRRHAVGVARDVAVRLGPNATRPVLAAALLHDVGKIDAGLGTFARVVATVWSGVRGRARAAKGTGRVARYLRHDEIGAELLQSAGSEPLTVAWAAEHHLPPARWSVPAAVGAALKAGDDD